MAERVYVKHEPGRTEKNILYGAYAQVEERSRQMWGARIFGGGGVIMPSHFDGFYISADRARKARIDPVAQKAYEAKVRKVQEEADRGIWQYPMVIVTGEDDMHEFFIECGFTEVV